MGFLPLIGLFANVALAAVGASGIISPATTTLIGNLLSGVTPLVGALTSGATKLQDVLAVLAGLSSIIAALEADTGLPADRLAQLKLLDGDVQAAITAYIQAGKGYDATNYAPIAPVA